MEPNSQQEQQVLQQSPIVAPLQQERPNNKKKKILLVSILLGVLLILLVGVTVFALSSNKKDGGQNQSNLTPTIKPTLIPFPKESVSENTLIIRYRAGSTPEDLNGTERYNEILNLLESLGVISQEKIDDYNPDLPDVSYKFTFKQGVDVEDAAQEIYKLPEIDHAEPEVHYEINN